MEKSYIPKAKQEDFCEGIGLCSVRKDDNGVNKVGIKNLSGKIIEENLDEIINADRYKGKKIIRVYSSGHIFLSSDNKEVFLVTTEKEGKIQHQFTGGSPIEQDNKEVIFKEEGVYKFDIQKVRENAKIRTKSRTGVEIIEEYNKKPIVDWVLMENKEDGEIFYKLVCLMHFIVKKYDGDLSYTGKEHTIGGKWYNIDELINTKNIAPNAYIVSKKALELI